MFINCRDDMYRLNLLSLLLLTILSGFAYGQNTSTPLEKSAKAGGLELPSMSIFGISPSTIPREVDKPFSQAEFEQFLAETQRSEPGNKRSKKQSLYWIIPLAIYKSRSLFSKESWTVEEIEQGQRMGDFFAKLADKPDLRIEKSDQESFKRGLRRLRDWFVSLCQDNKTLALMIFTLDDGPFFGVDIDTNEYSRMKLVESTPIPSKQASFILMTDGSKPEPMIIGVLEEDKSIRWLKRFSNAPNGRITRAELQNPAIYTVEGYGYVVAIMTSGTSGRESSQVYLDESLNLRFYFVSW